MESRDSVIMEQKQKRKKDMENMQNESSRRGQQKPSRMSRFFHRLRKSQCGGIVEYVLIVAVMAIGTLGVLMVANRVIRAKTLWCVDVVAHGRTIADQNYLRRIGAIDQDPDNIDPGRETDNRENWAD